MSRVWLSSLGKIQTGGLLVSLQHSDLYAWYGCYILNIPAIGTTTDHHGEVVDTRAAIQGPSGYSDQTSVTIHTEKV